MAPVVHTAGDTGHIQAHNDWNQFIDDVVNKRIYPGPVGPQGPQGVQGVQGEQGIQGDQGVQGIQGIQGDTGATGKPFTLYANYATLAALLADVPTEDDVYGIVDSGDADNGKFYHWISSAWTYISNLSGPQGLQGIQGIQGDQGIQGEAATITVGSVTSSAEGTAAVVTNSGTANDAVLDFTIPRGDTGATGPQGPQGIQGDQGIQGIQGIQGPQGDAATITVGTVTTGAPGSAATVVNSGTSGDAVFDFSIPKGDQGDIGALSGDAPITYNSASATIGIDLTNIESPTDAQAKADAAQSAAEATAATALSAHESDTTNVHGITDTSLLETTAGAQAKADAAAAASIPNSVVTAKGDILAASGSGAVDRLPVGAYRQPLVADSGQTLGVGWSSAIAGGFHGSTAFSANGPQLSLNSYSPTLTGSYVTSLNSGYLDLTTDGVVAVGHKMMGSLLGAIGRFASAGPPSSAPSVSGLSSITSNRQSLYIQPFYPVYVELLNKVFVSDLSGILIARTSFVAYRIDPAAAPTISGLTTTVLHEIGDGGGQAWSNYSIQVTGNSTTGTVDVKWVYTPSPTLFISYIKTRINYEMSY